MKFPAPLLLLAFLIPPVFAEDQTLVGIARGDGHKVRVVVHLKGGVPRTVNLDYSPLLLHPNREGLWAFPSTRDGVPGYEDTAIFGQSEVLKSAVRIKVGAPEGLRNYDHARGRMFQRLRSTYSYGGFKTWFWPNATSMSDLGGEPVIVDSGASLVTEPTERSTGIQEMDVLLSQRAKGDIFHWRFTQATQGWVDFGEASYISAVEMDLERVSPTRWKLRLKTSRTILDIDVWIESRTESHALLHER